MNSQNGIEITGLKYYVEFEEDSDSDNVDYAINQIQTDDYDDLSAFGRLFDTEEEAEDYARENMSEMENTKFDGQVYKVRGNYSSKSELDTTVCPICGYPVSDGHWHEPPKK